MSNEIISQYVEKLLKCEKLLQSEKERSSELEEQLKSAKKEAKAATASLATANERHASDKETISSLKKSLKTANSELADERKRAIVSATAAAATTAAAAAASSSSSTANSATTTSNAASASAAAAQSQALIEKTMKEQQTEFERQLAEQKRESEVFDLIFVAALFYFLYNFHPCVFLFSKSELTTVKHELTAVKADRDSTSQQLAAKVSELKDMTQVIRICICFCFEIFLNTCICVY